MELATNFVKRVEDYYNTEYDDSRCDQIIQFVSHFKFTPTDLDKLYWEVVKESSFPPDIRKINNAVTTLIKDGSIDVGRGGTVVHAQHAITAGADGLLMSSEMIVQKCKNINEKIYSQLKGEKSGTVEISTSDADFLHEWDQFYYAYSHLKGLGWEKPRIIAYLDSIKKAVAEGTFSYQSLPGSDVERDAKKDVARVLEDMEQQGVLIPFDKLRILK